MSAECSAHCRVWWQPFMSTPETISSGDPVVTLQSMKMEIPVTAESDGTIAEILVSEGEEIDTGAVIARLS